MTLIIPNGRYELRRRRRLVVIYSDFIRCIYMKKILALALITASVLQAGCDEKMEITQSKYKISAVDYSPANKIEITRIFGHYQNTTPECRSGGKFFGPVSYPEKKLLIGEGSSVTADKYIEIGNKCPLTLAAVSLQIVIQSTGYQVSGGVSLQSANKDGLYLLDCYGRPSETNFCLIANERGEKTGNIDPALWVGRIALTIQNLPTGD